MSCARVCLRPSLPSHSSTGPWSILSRPARQPSWLPRRTLITEPDANPRISTRIKRVPKFAFAFDIDGVLVRGSKALPKAKSTLEYLRNQNIPFILLTNGGGLGEKARAGRLTKELGFHIHKSMLMQSHTPFQEMEEYKDKTVLIVGGYRDWCRNVAEMYGFKNVVTPSDIFAEHPEVWPFSEVFKDYHCNLARSKNTRLPRRINPSNPSESLKIDAVFVYNDPRDWSLDATIILDLLLSREGILGTLSSKNNNPDLPNRGYLQDGQPPLFFSNPDLWFAADFALPRLGQGGFRACIEGLWTEVTGGRAKGVELAKTIFGKPHQPTYEYAEKMINQRRDSMFGIGAQQEPLQQVFMVGDNPESDIRGANDYKSPFNTTWHSILLRTGVYNDDGKPSAEPTTIQDDVHEAVKWAVKQAEWDDTLPTVVGTGVKRLKFDRAGAAGAKGDADEGEEKMASGGEGKRE